MIMSYLERDGQKSIYFEDYGLGNSAVVLVHGWGATSRVWDNSLPFLRSKGYRVLLLDHRGCGQSSKDFSDMSIDAIASDVVALIEHLGLRSVVLNGWSLGGAVVVAAAVELGERCKGVVLTCGATPCYVQKPNFPYGGTDVILAETLAAMAADRVNFLSGLSENVFATDVSSHVLSWMSGMFLQSSPSAAESLAALGPLDQRAELASLTAPILSFVGGLDAVVDPAVCRSVADYAKKVTFVECSVSGHAPFVEESELYHSELVNFIAKII
jgi:non-heme chloroperoxidase